MANEYDDLTDYARKLAELTRLTSGAAHEIRDPLNAIVLHLSLLRQKLSRTEPEMLRHVEVLERESERLHRMILGLLRFFRLGEPNFEALELGPIVAGSVEGLADRMRKSGIHQEVDLPDALLVRGDKKLLREAFDAVLRNACEAMAAGGTLRVAGRSIPEQRAEITIEDTGGGIANDARLRVFDLFYSTRTEGEGLGLSIAFRIVQLHGGTLNLVSTRETGSRFIVTLPLATA